ncbi:transposase DNA-binding-containing protein [Bradyrhizobium sp. 195]
MNVGSKPGPAGRQDAASAAASLPDKRLQRRLRRLLEQLSAAPGKPVPAAFGELGCDEGGLSIFRQSARHRTRRDGGTFRCDCSAFQSQRRACPDPSGHARVHLQSRVALQDRVHEDHQRWPL